MVTSPAGLGPESDSAERPSSNCTDKLQTRPLVREGAVQEENRKCLKVFSMNVKEKFVMASKWWHDTRTDWPTDRRS
jgi:hypothetical protein